MVSYSPDTRVDSWLFPIRVYRYFLEFIGNGTIDQSLEQPIPAGIGIREMQAYVDFSERLSSRRIRATTVE